MTRQKNQRRRTDAQHQRQEVRMDEVAAALSRTRDVLADSMKDPDLTSGAEQPTDPH